jgi:hypothetical protein
MSEPGVEITTEPADDEKLRDSEIAIIDALKMIAEILVARGLVPADAFRKLFASQRDGYIRKEMANAAVVMEVCARSRSPTAGTATGESPPRFDEPPLAGAAGGAAVGGRSHGGRTWLSVTVFGAPTSTAAAHQRPAILGASNPATCAPWRRRSHRSPSPARPAGAPIRGSAATRPATG